VTSAGALWASEEQLGALGQGKEQLGRRFAGDGAAIINGEEGLGIG
jgi:hypothetical protein